MLRGVAMSYLLNHVDINQINRFNQWMNSYNVHVYYNNYENLYTNWLNNDKYINYTNSLNLPYKLGHNEYSGFSFEEFKELLKYKSYEDFQYIDNYIVPNENIDWRNKGVLTPIKNQGQCASAWAFTATQTLESTFAIKYNKIYNFSEQQLLDCNHNNLIWFEYGCDGGSVEEAYKWISSNNGICINDNYEYISGTTFRKYNCKKCENIYNTKINDIVNIKKNSDIDMMKAISQQPISIGLNAATRDFQLYKSGIYTGECNSELNHNAMLIGYTNDYYILRNSFGNSWGEKGYMYIAKGDYNNGDGQCGILKNGLFPVI